MSTTYCSLTAEKWTAYSLDSPIENKQTEWAIICQQENSGWKQ